MTNKAPENTFFDLTSFQREDGTMDKAFANAFIEHCKASGAYFDITPYERRDGSLDDAWADAAIAHMASRATEKMKRLEAAKHDNDDEDTP